MIRVPAETLRAAAADLARIAQAYDSGMRTGDGGVLVIRAASGRLIAAAVCEDVPVGAIVEIAQGCAA